MLTAFTLHFILMTCHINNVQTGEDNVDIQNAFEYRPQAITRTHNRAPGLSNRVCPFFNINKAKQNREHTQKNIFPYPVQLVLITGQSK